MNVLCNLCNKDITVESVKLSHFDYNNTTLCNNYFDYCPNVCNEKDKVLWVEHNKSCIGRKIVCPYSSFGCQSNDMFKRDMLKHLSDNGHQHADYMSRNIDKINKDLDSMKINYEIRENINNIIKEKSQNECILSTKNELEVWKEETVKCMTDKIDLLRKDNLEKDEIIKNIDSLRNETLLQFEELKNKNILMKTRLDYIDKIGLWKEDNIKSVDSKLDSMKKYLSRQFSEEIFENHRDLIDNLNTEKSFVKIQFDKIDKVNKKMNEDVEKINSALLISNEKMNNLQELKNFTVSEINKVKSSIKHTDEVVLTGFKNNVNECLKNINIDIENIKKTLNITIEATRKDESDKNTLQTLINDLIKRIDIIDFKMTNLENENTKKQESIIKLKKSIEVQNCKNSKVAELENIENQLIKLTKDLKNDLKNMNVRVKSLENMENNLNETISGLLRASKSTIANVENLQRNDLTYFFNNLKAENDNISSRLNTLEASSDLLESIEEDVSSLRDDFESFNGAQTNIIERLDINDEKIRYSCGAYIWKIRNFTDFIKCSPWCPGFYSDVNGYKLQLQLEYSQFTDYITVYIRLLKGKYDDYLNWPFSKRVTIRLLDQEHLDRHYVQIIEFDGQLERPPKRRSWKIKFAPFIKLRVLMTTKQYLFVNNKLLLECFVEDS